MYLFWKKLAEWSTDTFGSTEQRGPIGPLKHLRKEVDEALESPYDLMEYADMVFLVFDSARRAGFDYDQLDDALWTKLQINKSRTWPAPTSDEPVEHVR